MKPIVIGCSAGIDSMSLLDMSIKAQTPVVVAHVNYKKRESADVDQEILEQYCKERNIPLYIYIAKGASGNFQDWARKERYDFYQRVADQVGADTVYLAHHLDDCLETYLFQKQSHRLCDTFGIAERMSRGQLEIVRPLLDKEKKELLEYCHTNQVPYGCDESNFTDDYTRNKIRHSIIDTMSKEEKWEMVHEMERENRALGQKRRWAHQQLSLPFAQWKQEEDAWFILDLFLYQHMQMHFGKKQLLDLLRQLDGQVCIECQGYWIEHFGNKLLCEKKKEKVSITLDAIEYKEYGRFAFVEKGKRIESLSLKESDFPITIRNVEPNDRIQLRYGTKRVHRFFIDRKMSKIERTNWLVVQNCQKTIVFVPGIGCDLHHFDENANVFMIQY